MNLSGNSQAILLLTAHFTDRKSESVEPLTTSEWGRFAAWLKKRQLEPCNLINENLDDLLTGWNDKSITTDRIDALLRRGNALGLAVDKWYRAGLWIMTRSDTDYPKYLKRRLKSASPPVLFGSGDRNSLNGGGLAVVGSRKANQKDLKFSKALGALAAGKDVQVISGFAKGVDKAAMLGALECGGNVIGVVAESLMKSIRSPEYRQYLMDDKLVLVTPFNPEAGFTTGNAMGRNKLIYCLSDVGFVVQSDTKGGTWTGAHENLKKKWVPLWVKRTAETGSGNEKIVEAGARWAKESIDDIDIDVLINTEWRLETLKEDLFHAPASVGEERQEAYEANLSKANIDIQKQLNHDPRTELDMGSRQTAESPDAIENKDEFYELFLAKIQFHCKDDFKPLKDLETILPLQPGQLKAWLMRATEEGKLVRKNRPVVKYHWRDQSELPLNPTPNTPP